MFAESEKLILALELRNRVSIFEITETMKKG
jgi:hypothetical protein